LAPEGVDAARERARQVLGRIFRSRPLDMSEIGSLRPEVGDYERVFVEEAAAHARTSYESLWNASFTVRVRPAQIELHVAAATVEELIEGTGAGLHFPGGYRDAARFFRPDHVWVCWELREPGAPAGMAFDGLVAIDDRWAWFPKPWRHMPARRPRAVSHWTE
jgi:hypothetical protein